MLRNDARLYDAHYFRTSCGQPYARSPEWLQFFSVVADRIAAEIGPRTVLDAGCAMGFLVEALRDRGVEAYGIDISDYAIQQVRPDVRAFCQVGSLTEPLPRRYDLIVCIEVLEHMPAADGEKAISNLCQATDDVLFSSSPGDFREATHFNVQPPEYWAERFAAQDFVRDVDFDATFITSWAVRFRRRQDPWPRLARAYERKLWLLKHENHELRAALIGVRERTAAAEAASRPAEAVTTPAAPAAAHGAPPGQPRTADGPVLVISHDVVGDTMAGPGIRYFNLARVLAREFEVVLAVPLGSSLASAAGFSVLTYADGQAPALETAIERARAVVVPAVAVADIPALARAGAPLAVDGHNPFQAETLYLREAGASDQGGVLTAAYLLGDFFFCASERQRDWWLGLLEANGRINAFTYGEDPSLRRLIDLVPYGLPSSPPQHAQPVLKGVVPGIGPDDKVLLWGGGLWPWLDPLTAIRAVGQLRAQHPELRLVLPATRHPNPNIAKLPNLLTAARDLAQTLGLLHHAVFFVDWVPYALWPSYLLESDLGLTLHRRDSLEARLAYRTRVLDYLWAGLPVVATKGDVLADLLVEHQLGAVVEPEDPAAVAEAILHMLAVRRGDAGQRFENVRRAFRWEAVARPLIEFCRQPRLAPDKVARGERLGNQYYTNRIADLEARVRWYDSHRMVKLARRLDPLVLRLPWLRRWVRS